MSPCRSCDFQCKSLWFILMLLIVMPFRSRQYPVCYRWGFYLWNGWTFDQLRDSTSLCSRMCVCCWCQTWELLLGPFCSRLMLLNGRFMRRLYLMRNVLVSQIEILISLPCKGTEVDMKSMPMVGWMLFWDLPVAEYRKDVLPTLTSPMRMTMKLN